jgi:hypothetical protein
MRDGFSRLGHNLTRKLKDIFIPFYGIFGGPGNPPDKTWDKNTQQFEGQPPPFDDLDVGFKAHDISNRVLGDLENSGTIIPQAHRIMRRASDRILIRHLLSHAPSIHLLDIAFSARTGGRPMIGSGYKLFAVTGFSVRGYILR